MVLNLKLLSKVRKSKVVTTQYPFSPKEVTDGFRGKPVIEYDKCMGCVACATVCPPEAITVPRNTDNDIITWRIREMHILRKMSRGMSAGSYKALI